MVGSVSKLVATLLLAMVVKVESGSYGMSRTFGLLNNTLLTFDGTLTVPIPSITPEITSEFVLTLPSVTLTLMTPFFARSLEQDKLLVFSSIENFISKFGMNGNACMKRAICEVAEFPSHENGLLGDIIDMVLSFSTSSSYEENEISDISSNYREAYIEGRNFGKCDQTYSLLCPISLFNLDFSKMIKVIG